MNSGVVIDCHSCATRIHAQIVGAVHDDDDNAAVLVECPSCQSPLVGITSVFADEHNNWRYDRAERVWPAPSSIELSASIPEKTRRDIIEARKCLSHGIYSASVVLCGRALERLTKLKAPGKSMYEALAELKAQGVIDSRLFDWTNVLRKERNLGAHAGEEDVTKENAEDVLAFTVPIFEYVFTRRNTRSLWLARVVRRLHE